MMRKVGQSVAVQKTVLKGMNSIRHVPKANRLLKFKTVAANPAQSVWLTSLQFYIQKKPTFF
jgi:hypothetical protein